MKKILIIVLSCTFLVACNEKEKEAHQYIFDTVYTDWRSYVPLDELITAFQKCKEYPSLTECTKLDNQLYDISASLETCKKFTESTLCKAVIKKISNHPIKNILPEAEVQSMPDHPFYFNLPTGYLNAYSSRAGYRSEMLDWWIQKYQSLLYKIIFGTMSALAVWLFFKFCRSEIAEREKTERNKIYLAQIEAQKKIRADEIIKREAEIAAKQKFDAEREAKKIQLRQIEQAIEKASLAEEKQKVQEAEAREAADKKQIEDMIKAAVKNLPKKK